MIALWKDWFRYLNVQDKTLLGAAIRLLPDSLGPASQRQLALWQTEAGVNPLL